MASQSAETPHYRIDEMEAAVTGGLDARARNNLYRQAMIEGADYESLAEDSFMAQSPLTPMYAAMATMKYAKASALKAR